ncbi:hypothetical protein Tco_0881709 [Tanacetum coccineum]
MVVEVDPPTTTTDTTIGVDWDEPDLVGSSGDDGFMVVTIGIWSCKYVSCVIDFEAKMMTVAWWPVLMASCGRRNTVYGKRSRAPKEHSKGRMDVIGWDFVLYNRWSAMASSTSRLQ